MRLILVDHNALTGQWVSLDATVSDIIDHHQVVGSLTPAKSSQIEMVGSCATLVAERILDNRQTKLDEQQALLLFSAIATDTDYLRNHHKTTEKDKLIADKLRQFLGYSHEDGLKLTESISKAKGDVAGFTVYELLAKDYKRLSERARVAIGMSSLPVTACEFLEKSKADDFIGDMNRFLVDRDIQVLINSSNIFTFVKLKYR